MFDGAAWLPVRAPGARSRRPGSVSGTCSPEPHSPRPRPFAPPLRRRAPAPSFAGFVATMSGSDFSRSCIIGYGSCLPGAGRRLRRRSTARSPGSRARNVPTCQGLRPRRIAARLALAPSSVLPSKLQTSSASGMSFRGSIPGLPAPLSTLRGRRRRRCLAHDSGPAWFATPSLHGTFTHQSLPVCTGALGVGFRGTAGEPESDAGFLT